MYEKRKSGVQASLDFLFYARRTSNSHHERYSYSLLGPGTLTAHRRFHLVLLHSCPDTVHGVLLRKTQTSTSLIEGSFAMKKPSDWHHPRCSGLRVQGTAISPAAHCLVYGISEGMSRNFCVEDGRKQRAARRLPDIDEREVGRARFALPLEVITIALTFCVTLRSAVREFAN